VGPGTPPKGRGRGGVRATPYHLDMSDGPVIKAWVTVRACSIGISSTKLVCKPMLYGGWGPGKDLCLRCGYDWKQNKRTFECFCLFLLKKIKIQDFI
jgi:hypothetical protein